MIRVFGPVGTEVHSDARRFEIVALAEGGKVTWRSKCEACFAPFFVEARAGYLPAGKRCPTHKYQRLGLPAPLEASDEEAVAIQDSFQPGMMPIEQMLPVEKWLDPEMGMATGSNHVELEPGLPAGGHPQPIKNRAMSELTNLLEERLEERIPQPEPFVVSAEPVFNPAARLLETDASAELKRAMMAARTAIQSHKMPKGISPISGIVRAHVGDPDETTITMQVGDEELARKIDPHHSDDLAAELAELSAGDEAAVLREPSPQEVWGPRLRLWFSKKMWVDSSWGPPPGRQGCLVPPEFMRSGR